MNKPTFTYLLILCLLFFVPLFPFKQGILSIEVILIPLLVISFLLEWKKGRLHVNVFPILPFVVSFALYFVSTLLSLSKAVSITPGLLEMARYLSYVFLFLIVSKIRFTASQYSSFAFVFGISALFVGIIGVSSYIFGISLNKAGLYALQEAKGRVDSTMQNPNYYSAFLNYVIPFLLLFSVAYYRDKKRQFLFFAFYSLYLVNLILTYTRAAWVTMAASFILLAVMMPKRFLVNVFKPFMLSLFFALSIGVYFLPDVPARTLSAIYAIEKIAFPNWAHNKSEETDQKKDMAHEENNETTNKAVVSRMTLWKTGWYMYRDNPLLGVGIGNYYIRYKDFVTAYPELDIGHETYSVHNSYLKVAAETGTIGILSFLTIYIVYFVYCLSLYMKQRQAIGKVIGGGLIIGSVCYMVQNLSNNIIFIPQLNVLFWLVGGLILSYLYQNRHTA
ncbi:O-antigen ligase family protein [Bacillus sp. 1P06AnD]|uniref:O-antigen ligase family protein n=1 Tax=Bacillus sp. 1P06AnD TaxID=3132208 RepID=UPI0039A3CF39